MIAVEALSKSYGGRAVVAELNFELEAGGAVALLGPNGAGKTTTMRMLAGYVAPDAGRILFEQRPFTPGTPAIQRRIGYLPEGAPSYADMTVASYLRYIACLHGLVGAAGRRRVDQLMQRLALMDVARQPIATLSKGYRRRVGLAQALLPDPAVLLLDEPTDGLDPNQKRVVRSLIAELAVDRVILISTHILEEVQALCRRVLTLRQGALVSDATPAELLQQSRYHGAVRLQLAQAATLPQRAALDHNPVASACEWLSAEEVIVFRAAQTTPAALVAAVNSICQQEGAEIRQFSVDPGQLDDVFAALTQPKVTVEQQEP